jgi:hypothetical protein
LKTGSLSSLAASKNAGLKRIEGLLENYIFLQQFKPELIARLLHVKQHICKKKVPDFEESSLKSGTFGAEGEI